VGFAGDFFIRAFAPLLEPRTPPGQAPLIAVKLKGSIPRVQRANALRARADDRVALLAARWSASQDA